MLEGNSGMTLENRREGLDGRPSTVRDLRFAGTVAAGCIAGVLGVGALTAPMLGWTDWSSTPQRDEVAALTLRKPVVHFAPSHHGKRPKSPSALAPIPVGGVPLPGTPGAAIVVRPGG